LSLDLTNLDGFSSQEGDQMQVVVNADDWGLDDCVNQGIVETYCHGVVTGASLMVNSEASSGAAQLAIQNPSLQVGLHFNITSGPCVAPKCKVAFLVDEEGRFTFESQGVASSIARFRTMLEENPQFLDQVEREFWAQVEKFHSLGLRVTHLDIHHYLSMIHLNLFEKYVQLANQLAVPFRGLCYPMINMFRTPSNIVAEMEKIVRQSTSHAPQLSLSNLLGSKPANVPSAIEYQHLVETKLQDLSSAGTRSVELVTHPTQIVSLDNPKDSYYWTRKLETALVGSRSFALFLKNNHISLVAHRDLT
jgi:predicted glycoside hydrolase/deacetylase ChbG (UPF0249 family)